MSEKFAVVGVVISGFIRATLYSDVCNSWEDAEKIAADWTARCRISDVKIIPEDQVPKVSA